MQNRRANFNITKPIFPAPPTDSVRDEAACCFSGCSLLPRILNAELTVQSVWLTPPPRLTLNKCYNSQDSNIDFRVVLSLACLRAFRRGLFYCIGFLPVHLIPISSCLFKLAVSTKPRPPFGFAPGSAHFRWAVNERDCGSTIATG